jgi:hypothetical protein
MDNDLIKFELFAWFLTYFMTVMAWLEIPKVV